MTRVVVEVGLFVAPEALLHPDALRALKRCSFTRGAGGALAS
jgi:hypothetical protein